MLPKLDRSILAGVVLLAVMIVGIAVTSFLNTRLLRNDAARATHSREILDAIGNARTEGRKVVAAQRSYIISPVQRWLITYEETLVTLRDAIASLRFITTNDSQYQVLIGEIEAEIARETASMNEMNQVRASDGRQLLTLIRNREAKNFFDTVFELFQTMERAERLKLASNELAATQAYERAFLNGIASALTGLFSLGLFLWIVWRSIRNQKIAATRIAENHELLNATLTSIGDGVIATDAEGNVTFLNVVAAKLTGWELHQARGVPLSQVFNIVNESSRLPVENPAVRALNEGVVVGLANHTVLIAKNGIERPIDDSAAPIKFNDVISGAVLVFRDISERKQQEADLQRIEDQRRLALDAAELGEWHLDPLTFNLTTDERFRAIFGVQSTTIDYDSAINALHPEDRERVKAAVTEAIHPENPKPYHIEYRVVHPDQSIHWVLAKGRTNFITKGSTKRLSSFDGTVADVTDRKLAEEKLRDAQARLQATLAAGEIATWTWDVQADRVLADKNFARLFGVSETEANGGPVSVYFNSIHPDDRPAVEIQINRALETGGLFESIYRVRSESGSYRTIVARGRAEYGPDGKAVGFPGVAIDITSREVARAALMRSQEQFRIAVSAAKLGEFSIDLATNELMCSELCKLNFGFVKNDDPTFETLFENIHPGDKSRVQAEIEEAIRSGNDYSTEFRITWSDQSEHWILIRGRASYGHDSKPMNMAGVTVEITDRKKAEEQEQRVAAKVLQAAEANAKFRTFFEQGSQFAGVMTLDGTLIEANNLWLEACGYTREETVGKKFWECGWWNRTPVLIEMIQFATQEASEGRHFRRESSYFLADGSDRLIDLMVSPVKDESGKVLFIAPTGIDITERKRAEEAIRFLADASASLAELVDYESTLGRIANLAVGGFADWCVVDILDETGERRRLAVTKPASNNGNAIDGTHRSFNEGPDVNVDIPHVLKSGEAEFVADISASTPLAHNAERIERLQRIGIHSYLSVPLLSRSRVIGCMTFLSASSRLRYGPDELRIAKDLAQRVTTAIENSALYRTLHEQDRRKDEFLATLAHELRNPLAPVHNGVQILRLGQQPKENFDRTLAMKERQLGHMIHLVDDLMDVSRVSSGKVVLRKESVDLKEIVNTAIETNRQMIERHQHILEVELPSEPLIFDADRTRLTQIIANLLNNAAKYTSNGGKIQLTGNQDGSEVVIRVKDTGIGIPKEMLPKIFDMFTQVGSSIERSQGGLGIGLTLVRRLVEMHGGTIAVHSEGIGNGSEFVINLPFVSKNTSKPSAQETISVGNALPPMFGVLVVDDNRDAAESLGMLLELKGHHVQVAYDGQEAIRILETYRPKLILLDLGLPGMTGYEVARRIRESTDLKTVTIAALTGWGQDEDRKRTKDAGFDHHLVKPADPKEVDKILEGVKKLHDR